VTSLQSENDLRATVYLGRHLDWVRRKLAHLEPGYRFKWDIYFDRLEELARSSTRFLDAGCGANKTASELPGPRVRMGIDIEPISPTPIHGIVGAYCHTPPQSVEGNPPDDVRAVPSPNQANSLRVCGDLAKLPFCANQFDLIGCRHVIEHLDDPPAVFAELDRVMTPGGRILMQTVNRSSSLIALSRIMWAPLRRWIRRHRYGRADADPFALRDRFNLPSLFEKPPLGFRLVSITMTQDVDLQSRLGFWLSYLLVRWTRNRPNRRSTITAEWEKR